jgi:hypothetical protein
VQLCSRFVGIEAGLPPDRAQRNFTDPDSRIQPLRSKAVIAGYNAQISIDGAHQIIVAQRLQTSSADARALPGLLADIRAVLGANPEEVSADAGYCDEQNLRHLARRRMDGYIAPGRARHGEKHTAGSRRWPKGSRKPVAATKLKRAAGAVATGCANRLSNRTPGQGFVTELVQLGDLAARTFRPRLRSQHAAVRALTPKQVWSSLSPE